MHFFKKLPLWKRRTERDNFSNFPFLDGCISKIEGVPRIGNISMTWEMKQAITIHLDNSLSLSTDTTPTDSYPTWVRQPFTISVATADVNDEHLDKIIELQQSQLQQRNFSFSKNLFCYFIGVHQS